jgi:hypothetical protein
VPAVELLPLVDHVGIGAAAIRFRQLTKFARIDSLSNAILSKDNGNSRFCCDTNDHTANRDLALGTQKLAMAPTTCLPSRTIVLVSHVIVLQGLWRFYTSSTHISLSRSAYRRQREDSKNTATSGNQSNLTPLHNILQCCS